MRFSPITPLFLSTLAASICLVGCADTFVESDSADTAQLALTDGTPEAVGLLAFLNDATTTLDVLDHRVPLNRRSARNLIHHRDGWDGVAGTRDDNLFDSVAEVDAVSWVGPSAMARLLGFALAQGWVPAEDETLGVWDGVSFTVAEADQTLAFANQASHDLLDHDLGLDRRAADSIVAAQPIGSIALVAGLYYVGAKALDRLKTAWEPAQVEPTVQFSDQFNHDEAEEIPDGSASGIDTRVHVLSVPDIAVDVVFIADFLHDAPEEIRLELLSPTGESWVFDAVDGLITQPLGSLTDVNGYWTLTAIDTVSGNIGELWGWALEVSSSDG